MNSSRDREVALIVEHNRAVEVARLLLGELEGPMKRITAENYSELPRRQLKSGKYSVRGESGRRLRQFCAENFENAEPRRLANLYENLQKNGSRWRLPLSTLIDLVGRPRPGVLKGAPLHATVSLSPWGLQSEYPEMHLVRDVSVAFNTLLECEGELEEHEGVAWAKAKYDEENRRSVADLQRRAAFGRRMCILSCFNLIECYINGIAWEYVQEHDLSALSNKKKKLLTEGQTGILDKLVKIPPLVTGKSPGPFRLDEEPLATFRDTIKPFRDSIVHASPFSAPQQFGGYEKLSKVYDLSTDKVRDTIEATLHLIRTIHNFLGKSPPEPPWIPSRLPNGSFELEPGE